MIVNTLKQSTLRRDVHVSHVHVCICVPPPPCTVHAILSLKGSSIRQPSQPHPLEPNPLVRQPDTEERQELGLLLRLRLRLCERGCGPLWGHGRAAAESAALTRAHTAVCVTHSHIYIS